MKERPIFPMFYELLSRGEDPLIRRFREEVAGEATGRVLEVGTGNGMNLSRYRDAALESPASALAEARRVLAPGGQVRFFEHVRAPAPRIARWQDRCNRPYGVLSGGAT